MFLSNLHVLLTSPKREKTITFFSTHTYCLTRADFQFTNTSSISQGTATYTWYYGDGFERTLLDL
jgi:hypothetical protein